MSAEPRLDLAEIRHRLAGVGGKRLWMSLEEIVDDPRFRDWVTAEFPSAAAILPLHGRREFLKLMGASLLLAGLAGCGQDPADLAMPYVNQPDGITPGVPRYYATAVTFEGYAQPVLATTFDARPTKLDGNPDHPVTRGRSDPFIQAAILQLYDPDRSQAPQHEGNPSTWAAFERELVQLRAQWSANRGQGLRVLIGNVTSPTLIRQLNQLTASLPECRLHRSAPCGEANRPAAMQAAFGRVVDLHYRLADCDVVVSLDDDLLGPGPHQVENARGWASRRGGTAPGHPLLRLHVAESTPSLTGTVASSRLPVDASRIPLLVAAVTGQEAELDTDERAWAEQASRELHDHAGRSLLAVGAQQAAEVQAQAALFNERLGNVGKTLVYTDPISFMPNGAGSLRDLVNDIEAGAVDTLIVIDANPAYAAPAELHVAETFARLQNSIHFGLFDDETGVVCRWHLPMTHALESWDDARAIDGTATIIQPMVAPLYNGRSAPQVLDMLLGMPDAPAQTPVRATWQDKFGGDFDGNWRRSLHDGFVGGTAFEPVAVKAQDVKMPALRPRGEGEVEIVFRPDPTIWDGRFANNAWLQELSKPLTKLTWDNAIYVSPARAEALGLANGDRLEVTVGAHSVIGPAWILPGQAANTITLALGYGRRRAGRIGTGIGYDAYAVRPANEEWQTAGTLRRVDGRDILATTQLHHRLDGFDFVREVTPQHPEAPDRKPEPQPNLYPAYSYPGHAWGMVIDLDLCIGCNACIAACTAENNIAVVGKEQVAMGRDMQWIRVDRYYSGDMDNPRAYFQPVPCMHCEKAPCEVGCPVHATVHSPEGLNQMIYNRCIGTRTCSSYCPYKVRRFNWFDYRAPEDSPTHAAENPEVTVRSRGVMEKCSYCVQRIETARAKADKENRDIRNGEVVTACQQACPTTAIVFGDLNDPNSDVARRRKNSRNYALLEELGTKPRTTYLARWKDESA